MIFIRKEINMRILKYSEINKETKCMKVEKRFGKKLRFILSCSATESQKKRKITHIYNILVNN